jgi:hypothetical protein
MHAPTLNGHVPAWLMGVIAAVLLGLIGAIYSSTTGRLERVEAETRIVPALSGQIEDVRDRLDRIEDKVDKLLEGRGAR